MDREARLRMLEQELESLFAAVRSSLADHHAENVRSFIDAAEYGLAFEEITGSLVEQNARITAEALRLAEDAAAALGKQNDIYLENLRNGSDGH